MTAPVTTYDRPIPLQFEPPLLSPAPMGLYAATAWTEIGAGEASRHLNGVEVRPVGNYGGAGQFGIWPNDSCVTGTEPDPGLRKEGLRAAGLDPFESVTVWAYDECDLTEPSRAEVQSRALQIMRLEEQTAVEREFAERMKADAGTIDATATDLVLAIGYLESQLALTNTVGLIHLGAQWVAVAAEARLLTKTGTGWTTPLGHRLVIGGGYVDGLENVLIATSPLFGWRDEVQVRTAIDERANTFAAVAERTLLVGYEHLIAAVEIVA
ncbi:hypothetical protein MINTM001_23570 [Mycobacterium paraintracellulare]|uniref:hypothetical protein n=1 Tax=Mycobacterium paraintracellulare TaxID=1138383 RepID=UPI001926DDAB|nr:hypothetical protein [Mycobacterium paraintracellulare]BCO41218.1 hypothetical protein MINTM001_23570 [Mycobacterium paraintracellulare]